MLKVTFDEKFIYFNGQVNDCEINSFTNFDEQLYNEIIKHKWNCYIDKATGELGAVRSTRKIGEGTMFLAQFILNHSSPEFYNKASEMGYTVEHLNNNKWDCSIDNLYLSLKLTNTYNGATLSKVLKENSDYISAKIIPVHNNETVQVQIKMNYASNLRKVLFNGELVDKINLLYNNDYNTVLSDVDTLLTSILDIYIPSNKVKQNSDSLEISDIIASCKNNDIKVDYKVVEQQISLTEDECETIRKVGYIFKVINGQLNAITVNEISLYSNNSNNNVTNTNEINQSLISSWNLK